MNPRSAPSWVGEAHSPNENADFTGYRRTPCGMATLPLPVQPESLSMPRDYGFGPHNNQGGSPFTPHPGEPDPENAISAIQRELIVALGTLQDQKLMTESKNLGLQNSACSETISQGEK